MPGRAVPSFLTWTLFRCQSAQEIVRYPNKRQRMVMHRRIRGTGQSLEKNQAKSLSSWPEDLPLYAYDKATCVAGSCECHAAARQSILSLGIAVHCSPDGHHIINPFGLLKRQPHAAMCTSGTTTVLIDARMAFIPVENRVEALSLAVRIIA